MHTAQLLPCQQTEDERSAQAEDDTKQVAYETQRHNGKEARQHGKGPPCPPRPAGKKKHAPSEERASNVAGRGYQQYVAAYMLDISRLPRSHDHGQDASTRQYRSQGVSCFVNEDHEDLQRIEGGCAP